MRTCNGWRAARRLPGTPAMAKKWNCCRLPGRPPLAAAKSFPGSSKAGPMFGFKRDTVLAVLMLFLLLPTQAGAAPLGNHLANHPSPYLALHGHDPVVWLVWNAATIARARQENKLLFVSVGYFACHWCHVMQRESYKNPQIAALLNRDFIPVKVDRELNTGLDDALQTFSARLQGAA